MKFKVEISVLFFAIICLSFGCNSEKSNPGNNQLSITLYESYNGLEIIPHLNEINNHLYSLQLDTNIAVSSGNKLMDQVKDMNMTEELYFKRNPLWKVFNLDISVDANGNHYLDSSANIGYLKIKDTVLFLRYLKDTFSISVLPKNYIPKFYNLHTMDSFLKVHFVKTNVEPFIFPLKGVSRIIVKKEGVAGLLGGLADKIVSSSTEVMFTLLLELDSKLVNNLKNETYMIQFSINDEKYSGSIVKGGKNNFIRLGHINKEKVDILKSEFGDKVIEE